MGRGKKISVILLVVFAVIGGGIFWIYEAVSKAQEELNAIVEPMIREMSASGWSKEVTDKYSSPGLKKWMVDNKKDNGMLSGLKILGKIKEYKGVTQFNASSSTATLTAVVQFDTGDAYISLQLSKHSGNWLIDSFNINSPALIPNGNGKQNAN